MNEIVDELRELNEDRFGSVELPDIDQLVEVEEQILISLPSEMREFLMTVSDVVYGAIEPVTASDPNLHTYLPEVCAQAWDVGLPREYIPICQIEDGYYCVSQEGEVLLWQSGQLSEDVWDSVWHWVEDIWVGQGR